MDLRWYQKDAELNLGNTNAQMEMDKWTNGQTNKWTNGQMDK